MLVENNNGEVECGGGASSVHFFDLVLELAWARVQARTARARAKDGGHCLIFMVYVVFICCG